MHDRIQSLELSDLMPPPEPLHACHNRITHNLCDFFSYFGHNSIATMKKIPNSEKSDKKRLVAAMLLSMSVLIVLMYIPGG